MAQLNHLKDLIWTHFSICNDENSKPIYKFCHERIPSSRISGVSAKECTIGKALNIGRMYVASKYWDQDQKHIFSNSKALISIQHVINLQVVTQSVQKNDTFSTHCIVSEVNEHNNYLNII